MLEILQKAIKIAFLKKIIQTLVEKRECKFDDFRFLTGLSERELNKFLLLLHRFYTEVETDTGSLYKANEDTKMLTSIPDSFWESLPGFNSFTIFENELDSLISGNFLKIVFDELDNVIAGEKWNKRAIFLMGLSAYLSRNDRIHGRLAGPTAVGKSFEMLSVLEFFPPEDIIKFTSLSPRFLQYRLLGQKVDGKILVITEFDGAEPALVTIKPMMSGDIGGIIAGIVKELEPIELRFEGIPLVFTSSTKIRLDPEFESRAYKLEVDESPEQTRRVMEFEATEDIVPEKLTSDKKEFIRNCIRILREVGEKNIRILYAKELAERYPTDNVIMRRLFKMVKSFIKTVTFANQFNRPRLLRNGFNFVLANFGDYETVFPVIQHTFQIAYTKGSRKLDEVYKVCEELKRNESQITIKSVANKMGISQNTAGVYLDDLVNLGRLYKESDPIDRRKNIYELREYDLADIPSISQLRASFTQNKLENVLSEISEFHNPLKIKFKLEDVSVDTLYSILISHESTDSDIQTEEENASEQAREGNRSLNQIISDINGSLSRNDEDYEV